MHIHQPSGLFLSSVFKCYEAKHGADKYHGTVVEGNQQHPEWQRMRDGLLAGVQVYQPRGQSSTPDEGRRG